MEGKVERMGRVVDCLNHGLSGLHGLHGRESVDGRDAEIAPTNAGAVGRFGRAVAGYGRQRELSGRMSPSSSHSQLRLVNGVRI